MTAAAEAVRNQRQPYVSTRRSNHFPRAGLIMTPPPYQNPNGADVNARGVARWTFDRVRRGLPRPPTESLRGVQPEVEFLRANRVETTLSWIGSFRTPSFAPICTKKKSDSVATTASMRYGRIGMGCSAAGRYRTRS